MKFSRRGLMAAGAALAVSGLARADGVMLSMTPQGPLMRVGVARPQRIVQQCPEWCWAASTAMVFAMLGHPTDQMQIVRRMYGVMPGTNIPPCLPAFSGRTVSVGLSGEYEDLSGQRFSSTLRAAYDVDAGVLAIDNGYIVNALNANIPLLYANSMHAMVVVTMDYVASSLGILPVSVGVIDPYPTAQAFRALSPAEMVPMHQGGAMRYLGAVSLA